MYKWEVFCFTSLYFSQFSILHVSLRLSHHRYLVWSSREPSIWVSDWSGKQFLKPPWPLPWLWDHGSQSWTWTLGRFLSFPSWVALVWALIFGPLKPKEIKMSSSLSPLVNVLRVIVHCLSCSILTFLYIWAW